jgi:hypothetical protein
VDVNEGSFRSSASLGRFGGSLVSAAKVDTVSKPGQANTIRDDLLRVEAYPASASASAVTVEFVETHVSLVFLAGEDVYKVKKSVFLGFLDFRTLEQRRAACDAEVDLNRRLAPQVYKGVVPVRLGVDGRHVLTGDGPIVDWAVHMARLPDARRADVMLAEGRLTAAHIDRIARRVARFHAEARRDEETARFGEPEAIAVNVRENFEQTRGAVLTYLSPEEADEVERAQLRDLDERADLFRARIKAGRVRDGHGDLRLEHVYLMGEGEEDVIILDCIEFNDRFRYADTGSDVAFLSMDLAWHGRVDLAELFLAAYAREADDFDLYPLIDFYEGYRAYVRGKVASILASSEDAPPPAKTRAAAEARRYFRLAVAAERAPLVKPSVVAVGGVIASGKSTLAAKVAAEMGAPVVEADRTRKAMLGVAPTARIADASWTGAYDPRFTEEVYREVLRRAAVVLASGRPVVLDASFRSAAMRRSARDLAAAHGAPFLLLECRAERELCLARLARREREASVSDGRAEIFDEFCARFEPITELPAGEHLPVDTAGEIDATMEAVRRAVGAWPRGLDG